VVEYLGSGARSTIWSVRDRRTNRLVALKRIFKQGGDDGRFLDQALNEYHVASQFDHPNLRKYYRLRRVRQWLRVVELHLIMELCPGQSCQARRPEGLDETVRVMMATAEALCHMHAQGFVHADMKPNNLIVADDGTVKIIDFGQSCPIGTIKPRIQGTPDFIAPEQVHRRPLDGRTDIFNLGATLYWILTGQPIPTILPKSDDAIQLVAEMKVRRPEDINPQVPPVLSRLVLDCIEPTPSRRVGSMKEVLSRLDLVAHTLGRERQ
jgi:serine/threonine-protein kinase